MRTYENTYFLLIVDSLLAAVLIVVMGNTVYSDSYYADIPQQASLVNIENYVFAKDNSGRRETRPMVGPDALYTFNQKVVFVI